MTAAHLIAFNLTLLAALISPGPAMLVALRATLSGGLGPGLATGLGLGLSAALWTAAALVGLEAMLTLFPWAYLILRLCGAAYLLWIAVQIWRQAEAGAQAGKDQEPGRVADAARQTRRALRTGLVVNLANPKAVLFAASVLVVIFPPGLSGGDKALIVANHLTVELLAYALFALALSTGPVRRGYLRCKPRFERVAASVLAALGLRLLLDR